MLDAGSDSSNVATAGVSLMVTWFLSGLSVSEMSFVMSSSVVVASGIRVGCSDPGGR